MPYCYYISPRIVDEDEELEEEILRVTSGGHRDTADRPASTTSEHHHVPDTKAAVVDEVN